jgi:hypothetical protein
MDPQRSIAFDIVYIVQAKIAQQSMKVQNKNNNNTTLYPFHIYGQYQYQSNATECFCNQANSEHLNLKSDNLDTTLKQHITHQVKIVTFLLFRKLCLSVLNAVVLSQSTHSIDTTLCGRVAIL